MSYASEVLADSPYVYWKLDESGGSSAADSSPNNRTGTYANGPTLNQAALLGGSSKSVLFDVTSTHLLSDFTLNTSPVTVEVWFDYDGTAAAAGKGLYVAGFCQSYNGANYDKDIYIDENKKPGFYAYDGATKFAVGASALTTGIHHLVGTFSAGTLRMYVDGAEVGNASCTSTSTGYGGSNIMVGGHSQTGGSPDLLPLAGRRDEFAVYTADIGAARIAAHYAAANSSGTSVQPSHGIRVARGIF